MEGVMKRLFVLMLLTALSGCTGFDEYYYNEGALPAPAASCGCNSPGAAPSAPFVSAAPPANQLSAGQTREPDLNTTRR
jgi:hypothetical protein